MEPLFEIKVTPTFKAYFEFKNALLPTFIGLILLSCAACGIPLLICFIDNFEIGVQFLLLFTPTVTIAMLIIVAIYTIIKLKIEWNFNKEVLGAETLILLYSDHVSTMNAFGLENRDYSQLFCVRESRAAFFLIDKEHKALPPIMKENCSTEALKFLKNLKMEHPKPRI